MRRALAALGGLLLVLLLIDFSRQRVEGRREGSPRGSAHAPELTFAAGWRELAGDLLWLKVNLAWEREDIIGTTALIKLTATIAPDVIYFRVNGARMIAHDMPGWRMLDSRGAQTLEERSRCEREQAAVALALLRDGLEIHHENASILIEMANIYMIRLRDIRTAAEFYHRAALQPHAPYYAGRIYAELLKRMGQEREAYAWLCEMHSTLPFDDERAMASEVLRRIRECERRLGILEATQYCP